MMRFSPRLEIVSPRHSCHCVLKTFKPVALDHHYHYHPGSLGVVVINNDDHDDVNHGLDDVGASWHDDDGLAWYYQCIAMVGQRSS